ncbi:MAG: hypothetical protein ACYC1M_01080 [Armatimonadota bacterium]
MPEKSWINRYGLQVLAYLGVSAALVLSYMGIKALERYDPMAHYSEQYADAGMNNAVLVCDDVKVSSRRYTSVNWQFQARHISMLRDLGSWNVDGLYNGSVTLPGQKKLTLKFASKTASYSRWERRLRMANAEVMPSAGKLITSEAVYDETTRKLELPKGCRGRYMDADVVFRKVAFNLDTNSAVVTDGKMTVAEKPALAVDNNPKPKKSRLVTVSFKSFEELQGKTRKGQALKVVDGDTQFQADQATQDIAKNTVLATGNLKMDDVKYSGTGDKADIEIKPRHAVITGHVIIVTKPSVKITDVKPVEQATAADGSKPAKEDKSLATERNKPATITCDKADVLYGTKIITLTGNLKIVQKITEGTRTLTADKAVYDVNGEVMVLTGNVYAVDEKGQELRVPSMTLGLKEGDEWIKATEGGTMTIIEEDEQ